MNQKAVVFFDGSCSLCNSSVNFIVSHNKAHSFEFIPQKEKSGSIVLMEGGNSYYKSTAVLKIAKYLDPPYNLLSLLIFIPPVIRDALYKFIALNRHKLN